MPETIVGLDPWDRLERRFDGPIPPADPARPGWPSPEARMRLFQRLAAERLREIARKRRDMDGGRVLADTALDRTVRGLRFYRDQGVAWTGFGRRG